MKGISATLIGAELNQTDRWRPCKDTHGTGAFCLEMCACVWNGYIWRSLNLHI